MEKSRNNLFKFILGLLICLLVRLIPFRAPNVEPILATQMPFARAYGALTGFIFGFFSIVLYDVLTHTLGMWTFITAGAYGILGIFAFYFFKKREPSRWDYIYFSVFGTLFFDVVTGLSVGPIFFHQSFVGAFMGQIPFTAWHLLGNICFAFILSPAVYDLVIKNKKLEYSRLINFFNPKTI